MSYTPGSLPKDAPPWITRELLAIAEAAVAATPTVSYDTTAVVPERPRGGQFWVADGVNWDPGYGGGPYLFFGGVWVPMFGASVADNGIIVACGGEATDMAVGLLRTFYLPYNVQIDEVIADVVTAPTGAAAIFDVKISGSSILSTKPQIEAGEFSSLTGAAAVISTPAHLKGARVQIYADQVGASVAGQGPKVTLVWRKVS